MGDRGDPCGHPAHRTTCNPSVGATLAVARGRGKAPPLRTTRYASVGADAYIGPPYRTSCNLSLRGQCAHWPWQSVTPVPLAPLPKGGWHGKAVTGGFFPRTCGRAHGPCPTKCCVTGTGRTGSSAPTSASVGADAHIGPPTASLVTLRRGGVLPRPRERQSPSPTYPL